MYPASSVEAVKQAAELCTSCLSPVCLPNNHGACGAAPCRRGAPPGLNGPFDARTA